MLGERIKKLRKQFGYSQQQLAIKLHLSQGAISQWENEITVPAAEQLIALAQVFGVSVDELLGRESVSEQDIIDAEAVIRERLRRDPSYHLLFEAANKATPEALKAAAAVLKALESKEDE